MKNYLLITFKKGIINKIVIKDYKRTYLQSVFINLGIFDTTYCLYDFKLNKYDEAYVDKIGKIKDIRRKNGRINIFE